MDEIRRRKRMLLLICVLLSALALPDAQPVSAGSADDFVITVRTSEPGDSDIDQFTIPTYSGETYKYSVDCTSDGHDEAKDVTGDYTCDYLFKGTYTIRIKDDSGEGTGFPRIYFNNSGDKEKLLSIVQWGTGKWTSMNNAFNGCNNLAGSPSDNPDLSNVLDMYGMFADAENFNAPIGGWDTSHVQDMSMLFYRASAFNQHIGNWDTGNVTDMHGVFNGASAFNQPIGDWDTSQVEVMVNMFLKAHNFNQPIEKWDTSQVTDMHGMFWQAWRFNQPIGSWDTHLVSDMNMMFAYASAFDQDLSEWDVSSLLDATNMFIGITLSPANYDALLMGWDAQALNSDVPFHGGNSTYCRGENARAHMIASDGWTITDGGRICDLDHSYLPLIFNLRP